MSKIKTLDGGMIKDTGYTVICPMCSKRSGEEPKMIGRERAIRMTLCEKCEAKKKEGMN